MAVVIWKSSVRLVDWTVLWGGDSDAVCGYGLVCVRCANVGVVEALYEPLEFGGICVEFDGLGKLFAFFCQLFV